MRSYIIPIFLFICSALHAQQIEIFSPDSILKFTLKVSLNDIKYDISRNQRILIENSSLGSNFDSGVFRENLKVGKVIKQTIDETYELITGKVKYARDYCNQMIIPLQENSSKGRIVNLVVRAYDDGIAFRYEFPKQENWNSYIMFEEKTQFRIKGNPKILLMFLPGYISSHEALYKYLRYDDIPENNLIEMPVTMEFFDGLYMSITEAAIIDYPGMYLSKENSNFVGKLSPYLGQEKIKVKINKFPHKTPWRVFSIGDHIETLIETNILTNLNEPCKIKDTSWIRSYKTTFPWWNGSVVPDTVFSPGNNFETNKYYIDFAARNKIDLHNIYGYAETLWYFDKNFNYAIADPNADITRPIPCLGLQRISNYAESVGVGIYVWVNWRALYSKLEEVFAKFQQWGIKGVMIDFMDRDDHEMIKIQEEFLITAAKYHLFVQFHGASKPSGLNRTYPNELTREGTLNYEVCKWDNIITADHDISIPFTRMLAGATDYHLGGFRSLPRSNFKIQYRNPFVMITRCHMLAMYVVLENNLVSLCDHPKAYEGQNGFEILKEVPGNWDDIKVTNVRFNEYISIARRKNDEWWLGAITNHKARKISVPLDFLDKNDKYMANIYTDAIDVEKNPNSINFRKEVVTSRDSIKLQLACDGGAIIYFFKNIK